MKRGYENIIDIFTWIYIILFIFFDIYIIFIQSQSSLLLIIEINIPFLVSILLLLSLKNALTRIRILEDTLINKNIIKKEEILMEKESLKIQIERLDQKCTDCNLNLFKNQNGEIFCPKCHKRYDNLDESDSDR